MFKNNGHTLDILLALKDWDDSLCLVAHRDHFPVDSVTLEVFDEWVCTDSRKNCKNTLFLPLKGKNFDGHNCIEEAVAKGAKGFLYDPKYFDYESSKVKGYAIAVQDMVLAYLALAKSYRSNILVQTQIVAITGSSGKTTLKSYLMQWFKKKPSESLVFATQDNENNPIGVAKTLICTPPQARILVVEMGLRHHQDLLSLLKAAEPEVCVLTCVHESHLQAAKTLECLYSGKLAMFRNSHPRAAWVGLYDDERIREVMQERSEEQGKVYGFGYRAGSYVCIDSVQRCPTRYPGSMVVSLLVGPQEEPRQYTLMSMHESAPLHFAALAAVLVALGKPDNFFEQELFEPPALAGRFCVYRNEVISVVDDAYNAHPQSMRMGLMSFKYMAAKEKKMLILGDMLDLGSAADRLHKELAEWVIRHFSAENTLLILVGKMMRESFYATLKESPSGGCWHVYTFPSSAKLIQAYIVNDEMFCSGKRARWIFVKGSRGMALDRVVDHMKQWLKVL